MKQVLSDTCTSSVCGDQFLDSRTLSNPCIMFVDQFRQNVDMNSSPNSRWVIKTEYKEIEKHWHIFILISFICIRIMIFDCTGY